MTSGRLDAGSLTAFLHLREVWVEKPQREVSDFGGGPGFVPLGAGQNRIHAIVHVSCGNSTAAFPDRHRNTTEALIAVLALLPTVIDDATTWRESG